MYYIIATTAIIALELLYFFVAKKFHIVDRPNERSSHQRVVLLGAGIIFYLAMLFYSLTNGIPYPDFLIGLSVLAIISYIDDLRQLPAWLRLFAQLFAVLFSIWIDVNTLEIWQIVLLVIVFSGILNIYNFMDGINGMLAAYSLVVVGTFGYLNLFGGDSFIETEFIATVMIAILVFGFFNFRTKARCFSGDVGSISMGLIILFLLVRYVQSVPGSGINVSRLCLIIVFLADGGLTIAKRFLSGRNILAAHREHAYETMVNDLKMPHLYVSAGYALLQLIINVGYIMVSDKNLYTLIVAFMLVVAYGLFFFFGNRSGKIHPVV
ncbi:MAG: UDP-GlcNAc--UDP-phosphate GlcNAc-1-phosphate transferase [Bacteroidales bacterium]|nr:UDP-GlcNAc--UDP-phosphate GlcNAc-1-phosphate transferase [Bacteroidales bacterium]